MFKSVFISLTITFLFSCSSTVNEVQYQLIKVDHGEFLDVVFRISNMTDQVVVLDEPTEGTCPTLVREWKYVKQESSSEWDRILTALGTAKAPPVFKLSPGESKDFVLISSWNKKDLKKHLEKEQMEKLLFRVWYTSTDNEGIFSNIIELNE